MLYKELRFYRKAFINSWKSLFLRVIHRFPIDCNIRGFNFIVSCENSQQFYMAGYLGYNYREDSNFILNWDNSTREILVQSKYDGREIKIKHVFDDGDFPGVFINEEYKNMGFENKIVIDIGGSIGESALYFVLRGAKKILCFEPVPKVFTMAKENVELNNLSAFIQLENVAVGNERKFIYIDDYKGVIAGGSALRENRKGKEIKQITIDDILEYLPSNQKINETILKIDCEGCEYGIFSSLNEKLLKKISAIVLEYHNGKQFLPDVLISNGFTNLEVIRKTEKVGIIMASKTGSNTHHAV